MDSIHLVENSVCLKLMKSSPKLKLIAVVVVVLVKYNGRNDVPSIRHQLTGDPVTSLATAFESDHRKSESIHLYIPIRQIFEPISFR